ncbi:copper resistance protein CopQ [Cupriavidus necator]|uniref:copper resistance protein CopQ n=1 Tax=Cupriavidus necator TaxID=106590 RepID=UPI00339D3E9E
MTTFKSSPLTDSARRGAMRWPRLLWLRATTHRRAMLHALLPTLVMMVTATLALSAKAAPRPADPYTDGAATAASAVGAAAAKGRFDVYTDGASVQGSRDTFTDGARSQERPADSDG